MYAAAISSATWPATGGADVDTDGAVTWVALTVGAGVGADVAGAVALAVVPSVPGLVEVTSWVATLAGTVPNGPLLGRVNCRTSRVPPPSRITSATTMTASATGHRRIGFG
jgi:hypothetical protein